MKRLIFTLPPRAKLSFSALPVGSDTFFAALANCAALLYGPEKTQEIIEAFPAFSSVFPGLEILDQNRSARLYFYPRPRMGFEIQENKKGKDKFDPIKDRKKLKRCNLCRKGLHQRFKLDGWQKNKKTSPVRHVQLM